MSNQEEQILSCNTCKFETKYSLWYLKRHVKAVHDKIKDNVCEKCNYATSTKSELNKHIKVVHDKIKDKFCEKCD